MDSHRLLTPPERYRALDDTYDFQQDLIDLGDHKARFALVIMFGLNAVAFLLLIGGDFVSLIPRALRPVAALYSLVYGVTAVYFFFQAIEALRPRVFASPFDGNLPALRFSAGIVRRTPQDYHQAWCELRHEQLCDEMAEQVHALAQVNKAKYAALRRLYLGLQLMTVMTALPIMALQLGHLL